MNSVVLSLAPILLTSCLYQDALQQALLPGSGQPGPLGEPPLLVAKPELSLIHSHSS